MLLALLALGGSSASAEPTGVKAEELFAFDSAAPPKTVREDLARVAELARANPGLRVVVAGHTDPIGTYVYNVGLSIRRAEAIHAELLALGVDNDQIVLTYFGENGAPRASYAQDRRVTVSTTRASLAEVTDGAFANRGVAVRWERPRTVAEIDAPAGVGVASR